MIRELVLVSGDISASPWFVDRNPPMPPVPEGISVRHAVSEVDARLFSTGPVPQEQAAVRFAEGDSCSVAVDTQGGLVAQMWCTERPRFVEWIGCKVQPPHGHVHLYNAWVQPDFRGLGLQWVLAAASCVDVMTRGQHNIFAGVERKEFPAFARKYAAMGLGVISPYKSIWAFRLFGMTASIATRPPRDLDAASEAARKMFARRLRRL